MQHLAAQKRSSLMLTRHHSTRHVTDTFLPFLRVLTLRVSAAGIRAGKRLHFAAILITIKEAKSNVAQFVYTMHRVGKVVPPKRHILKNISLSFFPGAKIGVLGLNGAGKSTLLRIMAGIDTDIEGEARPQPGIKIGYLPQEPQLNSPAL
jgi:ABC-type uncharacterized transport system fused permease/ATPase subunit